MAPSPDQPGSDGFARRVALAATQAGPDRTMPAGDLGAAPLRLAAPGLASRLGAGGGPRFEVGEVLGAGGIGRVLLVADGNLRREVAVKTPLPWQAGDPDAIEAFVAEARITASLEHPGIVPVHDLDLSADGQIYYAMRRVRGRSLGAAIGEALAGHRPAGIATTNDVVTVMLKVCDALAYAHDRGVIHRDLKPDNIMLGGFGEVLVLDWGASSGPVAAPADGGRPERSLFGTPAFMSPEQARQEALDVRSDVYSLGATLFQALFLRFPLDAPDAAALLERKRRGELDPLPARCLDATTRPLAAIALKAMAAERDRRYPSVHDFAADLRAYQAGQAMVAYRGSWSERLIRWHRRWGRVLWITALIAAVIATAGWRLWGERLKAVAAWGSPVMSESFADDSWRTRWQEGTAASFAAQGRRLLSVQDHGAMAWTRRAFAGPVAIEFDGEIGPGSPPGDISLLWFDGDPAPGAALLPRNGWTLQAGAYDNSFCVISRLVDAQQKMVARSPLRLVPGRVHHIRAEIDGSHLALLVDGTPAVAYDDLFPVLPGHPGIYAYYPGKAFSRLRIYSRGVPQLMRPLALGDDYVQDGQHAKAIERYRRVLTSHPDGELADEAWYKIGYCQQMLGQSEAAWEAWGHVAAPPYRDRVACQELDRLFQAGRHDELLVRLPGVVARSAACRAQCEGMWVTWAEHLRSTAEPASMDGFILARQRLFPGSGPSVSSYGFALQRQLRYDDIIRDCGDDPLTVPEALLHAGRADEAIARFSRLRWLVDRMRWNAGELGAIIADPANDPKADRRLEALAKSGRLAEALAVAGPAPRWQLLAAAGDWTALQARPPDGEGDVLARIAAGRTAEAVAGLYRQPPAPSRLALLLLGRDAEAEAERRGSAIPITDALRLVAALDAGDRDLAQHRRREVAEAPVDWLVENAWFGRCLLVPFLAAQAGDRAAWDAALVQAMERRARAGQRLWHLAGFLAGRIDAAGLRAQPFRSEAEAWLHLGEGMRADLAGAPAAARAAYLAFQALPLEQRLLEGFRPSPVLERFVAWRLRELPGR